MLAMNRLNEAPSEPHFFTNRNERIEKVTGNAIEKKL